MHQFRNILILLLLIQQNIYSHNKSIARIWNEVLLESIRNDYARPTVHARNLFHCSVLMYDSWAIFDSKSPTYFIGTSNLGDVFIPIDHFEKPVDKKLATQETMSYAISTLIKHRFQNAPKFNIIEQKVNNVMDSLGYDTSITSTDYSQGSYAALGNYFAKQMIIFGLNDGSNESNNYQNQYYSHSNGLLYPAVPGNSEALNFNSWQPLTLDIFIDQSGNVTPNNTPEFLSPEWGNVTPFSLSNEDLITYNKYNTTLNVYHDPGSPVVMTDSSSDYYKWGFAMVLSWSSHLDTNDQTLIDISPNNIGNIQNLPLSPSEYPSFYQFNKGGDFSSGHNLNPITQQPYTPQFVPRADYARVLAEFWADGPDSETPPGHWFTILNYVSDHAQFEKKWKGSGDVLSDLEWDVRSYLTLGGTMHDAAISAWSIKGYYDYIRPISAIRMMAEHGQCSDSTLPSYHPNGLPLINGLIELIDDNDPLSGSENTNSGKIKVYTWKGPDYIINESTDIAGVDWILAENWWPYQRPSFVTPPFAGYVSGHSVFSRAAAEVMTLMTGDVFFPGGMGTFIAPQNNFLVFEKGPTVDIELQWATYRDASDQTSLSRIYGGIHPPIDDIPGRIIGEKIGVKAFNHISEFFDSINSLTIHNEVKTQLFPNPIHKDESINIKSNSLLISVSISTINGQLVYHSDTFTLGNTFNFTPNLNKGLYIISIKTSSGSNSEKLSVL